MNIMEEEIIKTIQEIKKSVVTVSTTVLIPHVHGLFIDEHPVKGVGSGVIIDSKRHILTNNHVIRDAQEVDIILSGNVTCKGKVIGGDVTTDIAVIEIEKKGVKAATLGDSTKVNVGQSVFAIGSPLGLAGEPTVTRGVISALSRSLETPQFLIEDLLQTDAAINPGNSGGPLIDLEGNVIGINTAIVASAQGIGFAIPINKAKRIATELIEHGKIIRPYLGVVGVDITQQIFQYYNLAVPEGTIIARMAKGGPAHKAGLQLGDIVVQAGDHPVKRMKDLLVAVSSHRPGDTLEITAIRNKIEIKVTINLEAPPGA